MTTESRTVARGDRGSAVGRAGSWIPSWLTLALLMVGFVCGPGAAASEVELILDNDFGSSNSRDDDLYTFGVELRKVIGTRSLTFSERAFTDKRAGVRFDETTVSYEILPTSERVPQWRWRLGGGVAHVGRGALGQDVQNRLHSVLDNRQRQLEYLPSSWHPLVELEVTRPFEIDARLSLGPYLELSAMPGHKTLGLAAVRGAFVFRRQAAVRFMLGARAARASTPVLEPHLTATGLAWDLSVDLHRGVFVTWSQNRYGTNTGHIGLGYRFGTDRQSVGSLFGEPGER